MNTCSALPRSAPVRRPPRRRGRPSPSLPSPVMHREFSCPISPNLSHARTCLSTHPTAQTSFCCESHLKQRLFGRISQLNRGRLACPYAIQNAQYATQQKAASRCGRTLDAYALPSSLSLDFSQGLLHNVMALQSASGFPRCSFLAVSHLTDAKQEQSAECPTFQRSNLQCSEIEPLPG